MKAIKYVSAGVALAAISMLGIAQDQSPMSFFVTSVGSGDGANLGGLGGRGCTLPSVGCRGGSRRRDLACLPEPVPRNGRGAGQCA